jgi:acyl-CoA dehydrogenase
MIDFRLTDDVRELRARVAAFIDEVVIPAEAQIGTRPFFDIVKEMQVEARAVGLWCPFVPTEYGGMGLGHLANAIVQIEIGRSFFHLGAWALNCMGPQDATMLTLIEHGTEDQKARYLVPLVNGDLLLDDRAGGGVGCDGNGNHCGPRGFDMGPQWREMVLVRCRHFSGRPGDGEDGS